MSTNIIPQCSMPCWNPWVPWGWRDTRVTPVCILILILFLYNSNSLDSLGGSVRQVLTLVVTTLLTATAEELVRAAALPS